MKTLIVYRKFLTTSVLTLLISLVLPIAPDSAAEFEVGTQFGISRIFPDDNDENYSYSLTYIQIPSSFMYVRSSPPSLYATWFPNKQFAIGPEFSFGIVSVSNEYRGESATESITSLHLGGRASYFLHSHAVSTPYLLGRASTTIFNTEDISPFYAEDTTFISVGFGLGYQWHIEPAFVLRVEAQYQRVLVEDDNANEFSLIIGMGTRFGSNEK